MARSTNLHYSLLNPEDVNTLESQSYVSYSSSSLGTDPRNTEVTLLRDSSKTFPVPLEILQRCKVTRVEALSRIGELIREPVAFVTAENAWSYGFVQSYSRGQRGGSGTVQVLALDRSIHSLRHNSTFHPTSLVAIAVHPGLGAAVSDVSPHDLTEGHEEIETIFHGRPSGRPIRGVSRLRAACPWSLQTEPLRAICVISPDGGTHSVNPQSMLDVIFHRARPNVPAPRNLPPHWYGNEAAPYREEAGSASLSDSSSDGLSDELRHIPRSSGTPRPGGRARGSRVMAPTTPNMTGSGAVGTQTGNRPRQINSGNVAVRPATRLADELNRHVILEGLEELDAAASREDHVTASASLLQAVGDLVESATAIHRSRGSASLSPTQRQFVAGVRQLGRQVSTLPESADPELIRALLVSAHELSALLKEEETPRLNVTESAEPRFRRHVAEGRFTVTDAPRAHFPAASSPFTAPSGAQLTPSLPGAPPFFRTTGRHLQGVASEQLAGYTALLNRNLAGKFTDVASLIRYLLLSDSVPFPLSARLMTLCVEFDFSDTSGGLSIMHFSPSSSPGSADAGPLPTPDKPTSLPHILNALNTMSAFGEDLWSEATCEVVLTAVRFVRGSLMSPAEWPSRSLPQSTEVLTAIVRWINEGFRKWRNAVLRAATDGSDMPGAASAQAYFTLGHGGFVTIIAMAAQDQVFKRSALYRPNRHLEERGRYNDGKDRAKRSKTDRRPPPPNVPDVDGKQLCLKYVSRRGCYIRNCSRAHVSTPPELPQEIKTYIEKELGGLRAQ